MNGFIEIQLSDFWKKRQQEHEANALKKLMDEHEQILKKHKNK